MKTQQFDSPRKIGISVLSLALLIPVAISAIFNQDRPADLLAPFPGGRLHDVIFSQEENTEIAKQGTELAKKYCFQCHGGEASKGDEDFNILDHKILTGHENGYVKKGDLENSFLWQRIADNEMPPEKAKRKPTEEEKEIFKQWVSAGAPMEQGGGEQHPEPTAAEPGHSKAPKLSGLAEADDRVDSVPEKINVDDIAVEGVRVLNQYCGKCHPGKGNPDFDPTNRERMINSPEKIIVPGHPEQSLVWEQVADSVMPPKSAIRRNQAVAMTPADQEILKQWIAAGAPYPGSQPRGEFIRTADIWELAFADLRSMNQAERRYVRYFSLDNVYNNYFRYSDSDCTAHHAALSKICNSLSQESSIVPPHRVDPSGVLWRIDLRDYGWDGLAYRGCGIPSYSAWKLLLAIYPYGLSYSDTDDRQFRDNYQSVCEMTGSAMPIVRGDWFVFNAPQDELYYLINRIPNTDAYLEQHLGVDVKRDFLRQRLLRSAVLKSGVSVSNRLMDRHESRDGYYWKSYDFGINSRRNDLIQFPLGPVFEGHPYPATTFRQDGGEMIYTLPNGMQAYLLCDSHGNRIQRGPATVVGDGEWTSGTPEVVNAISCMNCHANGMRFYSDDVREDIAVFGDQKQHVEQLFDPRNQLRDVLKEDSQRFRKACYRCYEGVVDEVPQNYFKPGTEPVAVVARLFWKELNAADVGFELGIQPPSGNAEQLGSLIMGRTQGNIDLQTAGLKPLTRPNGKLRREIWDRLDGFGAYSLYQDVSSEFNIAPGRDCSTSDSVKIFEAFEKGTELLYK